MRYILISIILFRFKKKDNYNNLRDNNNNDELVHLNFIFVYSMNFNFLHFSNVEGLQGISLFSTIEVAAELINI